jgi:TonB family protein
LLFSLALASSLIHRPATELHPISTRQFIDINLTSFADYQNHKEVLPGTKPKPTLAKRIGSTANTSLPPAPPHKIAAAMAKQPSAMAPMARPLAEQSIHKAPAKKQSVAKNTETMFVVTEPLKAKEKLALPGAPPVGLPTVSKWKTMMSAKVTPKVAPTDSVQMEEVAPMKLMEVTDNDGDTGTEVWQAGGRTSGGKGARSPLAAYLKELHKRLKRAWSPPVTAKTGYTEVLFRVLKDGRLTVVKLAVSSGDNEVDQSAMNAVARSAPFSKLPDEYLPPYLDLRYKFNYTVDQLKEVQAASLSAISQ